MASLNSIRSGFQNARFAVVAGLVAGGMTLLLGQTSSPPISEVTRIGASVSGTPLVVAALIVGVVSVGRSTTAGRVGAWTGVGTVPVLWWFVLDSGAAALVAAETAGETAVFAGVTLFGLVTGLGLAVLIGVVSAVVGARGRRLCRSLAQRVAAG